jgi:hypothetical protein
MPVDDLANVRIERGFSLLRLHTHKVRSIFAAGGDTGRRAPHENAWRGPRDST